jgi:ABC-type nitrate/sulfonate/bicarbonate transport system ATPase subunit
MRAIAVAAGLGALRRADLDLTPGRYVVLGNEQEPLHSLVALLAGREPPRAGRVALDNIAPSTWPETRRRIAALFHDEALPPASSVLRAVAMALAARGESSERAAVVLEGAGLAHLAELSPSNLGQRETRSIALALALSHHAAELLVLHEPLTTLVPGASVAQELDFHTSNGALVVCTTTSTADATLLGGRWLCVELGRIDSREPSGLRLGQGQWQQVLIETSDPRALSRLLQENAQGLSSELGATPRSLKVMGPALDVTVRELVTLARKHELEIFRIEAAVPPVEALLAARAGYARGAYEAARAAALGTLPGPPPSLPPPPSYSDPRGPT